MDLPLLLGVLSVSLVLFVIVISWRSNSAGSSKKDDSSPATDQSWRNTTGQTIDPMLRNRHGIQNGEIKEWTLAEIAQHNKQDDLFMVIQNKVYDLTDFVEDHPGGTEILLKLPGLDNTEGFSGIQHPAKVWDMITEYYCGEVKKEEHKVYTFKNVSKL